MTDLKILANTVFSRYVQLGNLSNNWLPYLIDPAFDREPELRNKIFCIYANGLIDACHELDTRVNGLRTEARKIGARKVGAYIDALSFYAEGAIDVLSIFSREELIFIVDTRHQWVHGRLDSLEEAKRPVYYVQKGRLIATRIEKEQYREIIRSVYDPGSSTDSLLEGYRHRFYQKSSLFWLVNEKLRQPQTCHMINEDMRTAGGDPAVQIGFHPKGFLATAKQNPSGAMTLMEMRRYLNDVQRRPDSAVH